jgi:hypothetical protein
MRCRYYGRLANTMSIGGQKRAPEEQFRKPFQLAELVDVLQEALSD